MEFHERPSNVPGVVLLDLDGGLDHTTTGVFVETMDRLLAQGKTRVVLDLEHCVYASSLALAAMVRVHHHYAVKGGRIAFAKLHSALSSVLRGTRLDRLFDMYDTVEEAVKAVSRSDAKDSPPAPDR